MRDLGKGIRGGEGEGSIEENLGREGRDWTMGGEGQVDVEENWVRGGRDWAMGRRGRIREDLMSNRVALSKNGAGLSEAGGDWTKDVGDLNSSRDRRQEVVGMEGDLMAPSKGGIVSLESERDWKRGGGLDGLVSVAVQNYIDQVKSLCLIEGLNKGPGNRKGSGWYTHHM